jgi:hypothetical protein
VAVDVNYSVRKRSPQCDGCAHEFEKGEQIHSRLIFENGEYMRLDYCKTCKNQPSVGTALSSWKTLFIPPAPGKEDALKKENAETLLYKLIEDKETDQTNPIYILAVMLERKRILIERDVQMQTNGKKLRIYEHKKSGETLLITDPDLKLTELSHVQQQVIDLLGGKQK